MREMKDSGIEWIGEIPKEWSIVPHKRIMHKVKEICEHYNGEDIISLTMNGVIKRDLTAGGKMPTSFDGYQYVEPEDLLLCLFDIDVTPRCVGIVRDYGVTSPAYSRFRVHGGYSNKYFDYLLRAIDDDKVFVHLSKNLRSSLTETDFGAIKTCVPPIDEQEHISEFLDSECAEIDAVLEKTRASIDEYKKLKQSVITQAVTKGIRGDRPMKDSGESFLHKVPVGWTNSKIKYCAIFSPLCNTSHLTEDSIVTFTPMECIKNGYFENREAVFASMNSSYTQYQEGDIVFAKVTPCFENGNIAIMQGLSFEFGFGSSELFVLRPKSINTKFLFYYLQNDIFKQYACATMTGTGGLKRVSPSFVRNFPIFLPSDSEQADIAEYLDYKCKEIDLLISKKQQYLTEIENYKKSLIYEYATGKKECPAINQNDDVSNAYPYFPAPVHASSPRFAQAVLMSKILEESSKGMGRVKLEKTLFTIENHIGFNFDTEYLREAAGPLDASIYECEKIITRRNKWFSMKTSSYGVSYAPTNDVDKYKKYYAKYFSEYNSEIERIIDVFRNYTTEQAEIIATLFAAWNDAIIDKKQFTDDDIVDDVLNNWHESKRRFPRQVWLRAMNEIRKNHIIPKGYGKHTVMKEMQ